MSMRINQQSILLTGHLSFCMQNFQRESTFAKSTAPPSLPPEEPEQGINQNGDHALISTCFCVAMYVTPYHTTLIGVWLGDPRPTTQKGRKFGLKVLTLKELVLQRVFPMMLKSWLSTYCQLCLLLRSLLVGTAQSPKKDTTISLTKGRSMALDVCLYFIIPI